MMEETTDTAAYTAMVVDCVQLRGFNLWYGEKHVFKDINLSIKRDIVTAFTVSSGCGRSTILRSIDRINGIIPSCRTGGEVLLMARAKLGC